MSTHESPLVRSSGMCRKQTRTKTYGGCGHDCWLAEGDDVEFQPEAAEVSPGLWFVLFCD